MFIVVDKKTGRYKSDTGMNSSEDKTGIYENLYNSIDKSTEKIIEIDDDSPFIHEINNSIETGNDFSIQLEAGKMIGLRLLS